MPTVFRERFEAAWLPPVPSLSRGTAVLGQPGPGDRMVGKTPPLYLTCPLPCRPRLPRVLRFILVASMCLCSSPPCLQKQ